MTSTLEKIVEIWLDGGWVMIALAGLAVLLYATGFHLLFFLRKGNLRFSQQADWAELIENPNEVDGRAKEIIRYTQENTRSNRQIRNRFDEVRHSIIKPVEQKLIFLNKLVAAAPLMGLLGTVIGMLGTFAAISSGGGNETAGMVADGISEALITTQTGLFVSLPGLFLALVIRRRKHTVEAALARIESLILCKHKFDELDEEESSDI